MSKKTSSLISDSIVNGTALDVDAHKTHVRSSKKSFQQENESQQSNTYKALLEQAHSSEKKNGAEFQNRKLLLVNRTSVKERQFCFVEERIPGFHGAKMRFTSN